MYLKLLVIAIILNCLVEASYAEANQNQTKYSIWKKPTIEARQNELSLDEVDNLSATVSNLEISVNSYERLETITTDINLASENSTEISPSETDNGVNVTETDTQATFNENESSFNTTEFFSEETTIEIETSVNVTENFTEVSTTETDSDINVTEGLTEVTPIETETTVTESLTDAIPTENDNSTTVTASPTEEVSVPNNGTESTSDTSIPSETIPTETSETEALTEPILTEPTSQEPETTTVDPKYRNETLELYLEEFMKDNPLARMYQSEGFGTGPYGSNLNINFTDTLTNCTGIDVIIHFLDLDPFQPDSLNIRGGDENATNEEGKKFTGHEINYRFKIIHTTTIFIWFNTGPNTEGYKGFVLSYAPFGDDTPPTTTTEPPVTIPQSDLQKFQLLLVLPEENRTTETWQQFKEVLSYSAAKYVSDLKLHVQQPLPENVTFNIFKCPDNWPNYETCLRFVFAIPLWDLDYDPEVNFDLSIFDYELNSTSLSEMWELYGRDDFLDILGIEEYTAPDGTKILLLWTGISLSIIVIFIGVLYSIWRIDIFREYRRMHGKSDDQHDILKDHSEIDISMYPIPHQPYPTLFETNEVNSAGYYDSNEMNVFQNYAYQEKPSTPSIHRHATSHFSPNIVYNDSQFFPDDEEDFGRIQSLSPRTKQKLLVLGAKRDESIT